MPMYSASAAKPCKPSIKAPQLPIQKLISDELDALERKELRSEHEVKVLHGLLADADEDQRRRAEHLYISELVNAKPLIDPPKLGIVVETRPNGTKDVFYYEVLKPALPLSTREVIPTSGGARFVYRDVFMRLVGTARDARGLTPSPEFLDSLPDGKGQLLRKLVDDATSITFHGGIPNTWDSRVDRRVFKTNIDTVHFSDWLREAGVFTPSVRSSAEVGCGAGALSQLVLASCPNLERHIYTDINPFAINAARRNLRLFRSDAEVTWAIGKEVKGLVAPGSLDLLICNPPYIPHPDGDGDKDHYRGTKLIRRLFEDGIALLNPENSDAAIYVQMSSVTLPDFRRYQCEFPDVEVIPICEPVRVPLRLPELLRDECMMRFLEEQGGLEVVPGEGLRHYHRIMAYRLKPKR